MGNWIPCGVPSDQEDDDLQGCPELVSSTTTAGQASTKAEEHIEDECAHAWLKEHGFVAEELCDSNHKASKTPMAWACQKGELKICEWLYRHGGAPDICKPDSKDPFTISDLFIALYFL